MSVTRLDLQHIRVRYATFRDLTIDERSANAAQVQWSVPAVEHLLLDTCHRVELASVDDAPTAGPCLAKPMPSADGISTGSADPPGWGKSVV